MPFLTFEDIPQGLFEKLPLLLVQSNLDIVERLRHGKFSTLSRFSTICSKKHQKSTFCCYWCIVNHVFHNFETLKTFFYQKIDIISWTSIEIHQNSTFSTLLLKKFGNNHISRKNFPLHPGFSKIFPKNFPLKPGCLLGCPLKNQNGRSSDTM